MRGTLSGKADLRHSGLPFVSGAGLVDKLLEQIKPFEPTSPTSAWSRASKSSTTAFRVTTDENEVFEAKVVVIAAGGGSFQPKRPPIPGHRGL